LVAVVAAGAAALLGATLRDAAGMRAFSFSFEIFDADSLLFGLAADDMTFLFSLPSFSASLAF
jgi:hypothetical protein